MDKNVIAQRFAALAASDSRSKMDLFRDVFPSVQTAIEAGVTRAITRDEPAKLGLYLTYKTFMIYLDRVRQEQRASGQITSNKVAPKSADAAGPVSVADATSPVTNVVSRPRPATGLPPLADAVRHPELHPALPDEWHTCKPFPGLQVLLTPEQNKERRKACDARFDPSPYDHPSP